MKKNLYGLSLFETVSKYYDLDKDIIPVEVYSIKLTCIILI